MAVPSLPRHSRLADEMTLQVEVAVWQNRCSEARVCVEDVVVAAASATLNVVVVGCEFWRLAFGVFGAFGADPRQCYIEFMNTYYPAHHVIVHTSKRF